MQIEEILGQEGIQLMNDIRANMGGAGMNVTNETSHSLRINISPNGARYKFQLLGRPYFMTVETGRKPTPDKKPSREMIDRIKAWTEGLGMDSRYVWGIATNIQKKGTKLFQEGGRTDIVTPAIESFLDRVSQSILTEMGDQVILKVRELNDKRS